MTGLEDRSASSAAHKPVEIRVKSKEKALEIDFDDGMSFRFSAEFLRVHSPSAEVQGHSPDQRQTVAGRRHVGIMDIEQVGNYAIRITFDDLHDTGIYSWQTLYRFGERREEMWQAYLDDLAANGLSRDPA